MTTPDQTLPLQYGLPITLAQASRVARAAEAEAERHRWSMAIAIVDSAGHLVLFRKMDQTQLGSIVIAQRKAETAVAFRRPTLDFERRLEVGGGHLRMLAMGNVMPIEGGMPLVLDGVLIGGIGVSGMAAAEDAQCAQAGSAALPE